MAEDDGTFLSRWSKRKAQAKSAVVPVQPQPPVPVAVPQALAASQGPVESGPSLASHSLASHSLASHSLASHSLASHPLASHPLAGPPLASQAPAVATPPPPLTMDDVALLTPESDYSRFVAPGVDAGVSNAAMRKLFTDPHFNVMDRLDIYIDDYSQPDPIPASMLRQMVQAKFLGLFDDEEEDAEKDAGKVAGKVAGAATLAQPPAIIALDAAAPRASHTAAHAAHDDHPDLQLQPDDAAGRSGPGEGAGPRES